ncbi:hypothetical protein [Vibrio sp. Hep-1b-8]|uniref:hypothetical protein n=1 Tax=Vibrio sp. Hep-1b-8 TaxID=2144187 RepID=UPI001486E5FC|nr:hypothetical protein [Vibrio sp. Hep-1b-8]
MKQHKAKTNLGISFKVVTPKGYVRKTKPLKDEYKKVEELQDNHHNPNAPAHIVC